MYRKSSLQKIVRQYGAWQGMVHRMKGLADRARSEAKRAISQMRRDRFEAADSSIRESEKALREMSRIIKKAPRLSELGFYKDALEEYVEAVTYKHYLKNEKTSLPSFVSIGMEEVIGGVCDMTGELVRRAITLAGSDRMKDIESYREYAQAVADQFSRISFSGKLRAKYDDVERNVKQLEQILYDIKIKS